MRSILALVLMASTVLSSDVIVGNSDNWDDLIKKDFMLAEFYAPWCGHCKKLAPEWDKAATELLGTATLVKVDATIEKGLADKYDIEGYPTIKVFIDGKISTYEGGRSSADIVSWVGRMAGPAVTVISNKEELAVFRGRENVVTVAYLEEGSDELSAYEKIATENRKGGLFGVSHDAELAKATGAPVPGLAVYKSFDKDTSITKFDASKVMNFIRLNSFPLFDEISSDTYKLYVERGLPIGWLFVDPENDDSKTAMEAVEKAAQHVIGKASMVWLDAVQFGQMAERVGIKKKVWPAFSFDKKGTSYVFDSEKSINSEEFQQWVIDWGKGNIDAKIKSADIPEQPTTDGLTVIVGDTFKEIAFDTKKDVLIKFYAPWCGHCKKMLPEYESLAKTFEKDESIVIAKIDGTANDIPSDFDIQGYPTIILITADPTNEMITYNGGRSAKEMEEFIRRNAKSL
eukprot:TRINITY_DN3626_c1_g1_i2.p1 TRINITY_DN3626_c1_g1~~TRINITY_DN3626_c1_g1_i2.p1  ORF type:complete len:458 (+),score=106.65 TRINITY_DN3626_c1_g1_i2:57-1430(+)